MIKKLFFYILISFSIFAIDEDLLSIINHKYYYKGKLYNGEVEIYYIAKDNYKKTNKIYMKAKVVQGILNGQCKVYFDNGKLYKDENYKLGKKHGVSKSYYDSGKLFTISQYNKGSPTGEWFKYHKNGKIFSHSLFKNGQLRIFLV